MKHYDVYVTQDARDDIKAICDSLYSFTCSKRITFEQYRGIEEAIQGLEFFPKANKQIEGILVNGKVLRRMMVGKYSVLFVVEGNDVVVLNVVYSSGNLMSKLLSKFL